MAAKAVIRADFLSPPPTWTYISRPWSHCCDAPDRKMSRSESGDQTQGDGPYSILFRWVLLNVFWSGARYSTPTTACAATFPSRFRRYGGRTILRAGDGGKGLSSASAPDSPGDERYDIYRNLLHRRYIRSGISTNWVLVVFVAELVETVRGQSS